MITFFSPWILGFLAVIPALWWLLRVLPPRPREVRFPAFFLLKDLETGIKTSARTPWWLLLLRALLVACFILAMAGPVQRRGAGLPGGPGPALIVIDNGWAAAAHWRARQDKVRDLLPRLARSGRSVVFIPTAPSESDGGVRAAGPMSADEAAGWIDRLSPAPWPADYAASLAAAGEVKASPAFFLSDGTEEPGEREFLDSLAGRGGLTVVRDDAVNDPYILRRTARAPGILSFSVERLSARATGDRLSLLAFGTDGGALDEYPFSFPPSGLKAGIAWELPQELRGKVARVALRAPVMASAVYVTDSRWRRRPVGIVSDPSRKDNKSFLNEVYYLRRALEDGGAISVDAPSALVKNPVSAILWPDSAPATPGERALLLDWVRAGGFLIRFAGATLADSPDDALLPVKLRYGQRSMEGAMTWEKPVKLGPIPEGSPLLGLAVPGDAAVTRQILAEPSPDSFEKTWLTLEDGTPLITGGPLGSGMVVLVHTTAGPDWSDFCYSGLYVEALRRMVALSTGITDYTAQSVLPPLMLMDAFGGMQPPGATAAAAAVDPLKDFTPSPRSPPGLYGDAREFQVFNLGDHLPPMKKLSALPAGTEEEGYGLSGEKNLKAAFLRLALLLLLLDTLATLFLRGVISFPGRAG